MKRAILSCLVGALMAAAGGSAHGADPPSLPFTVTLREVTFAAVPGLQSFAVARAADGRWLCIGGRQAGLHGRSSSPPLTDNFNKLNDRAWVIDAAGRHVASRRLVELGLTASVADSLAVVHPEFVQDGDRLYLVGGYGLPTGGQTMRTYGSLTVVDVPQVMTAIVDGTAAGDHIRQSPPNPNLRVTGGSLGLIGGTFYLAFGQQINFNYSEAVNGLYTFQVRPFRITDTGAVVSVTMDAAVGDDSANPGFRRRDLNVLAAIRPDGGRRLTAYGGVFQPRDRTAWTRPIDIDPPASGSGPPSVIETAGAFQQRFCQYNCATLAIHSAASKSMYAVFFGGISQAIYTEGGGFQNDEGLPFVDLVSCISRAANGSAAEFLVGKGDGAATTAPLRLPALLGAGARFIPAPPSVGVLELDALRGDILAGHIYGGIVSDKPHGGTTDASNRIFEVHVAPVASAAIAVPAAPPLPIKSTPQGVLQ
ncbi:hypothetical protein [Aquisphaera insulae]|uniref:hypothetical protein n=1 Tax=Aquisphaera insulae TaxID=2712864 RepID=UPI0013E9AAB0|nr:hypothetical protein [Aquisphaera insulae]